MKKFIDPLLRWWWLIILSTLAATVSGYLSVSRKPLTYEARASLMVGRTISDPNPSSSEFYLEQQLATVYASVGSRQVAGPTMKALGLSALPAYVVRPVPNSPLIDIVVTDTSPKRAQAVANELANQLVNSSPSAKQDDVDVTRQAFVREQLDALQAKIKLTEQDISDAQQKLSEVNSARQIADIQTLINALEQKQLTLQTTYTNLLASTRQGALNNLAILQLAPLPGRPVGPNKILYMALAGAIGLVLSLSAAYGIEMLDNRLKTGEDISQALDTPILGNIPIISRGQHPATYTMRFPRSPITDTFRTLRTNIEFMGVNGPVQTILVTGPDLAEGKSTVASNLALIFAQSNKRVVLIDADLRRPQQHIGFGVSSEPGVSDVCVDHVSLINALVPWESITTIGDNNQESGAVIVGDQFRFLPSGIIPPNPAELLSSTYFHNMLEQLKSMADIVIIDSPPLFLPDTSILLSKVDGVLLVFQPRKTRKSIIGPVKSQLQRSRVRLLGIVLNRSGMEQPYYHRYQYEQPKKRFGRINLPWLKFPSFTRKA